MNTTPNGPATGPQALEADARAQAHEEAAHSDFAATRPDDGGDNNADWWPESADGQCSQSAALFAASQPAPLSVV